MQFAAVHESAIGVCRTCRGHETMSGNGGQTDLNGPKSVDVADFGEARVCASAIAPGKII